MGKRDDWETKEIVEAGEGIHPDLISSVNADMPDEELLYDLAELYKVFGDTTRIKILYVLFESEMCVGDLSLLLEMNQSAVSHQLRILKQARLVKSRRDGKSRYYSLDDDHIQKIFQVAFEHILED